MSARDFLDDLDGDDEVAQRQRPVMIVPGIAKSSAEFDATIPNRIDPEMTLTWDDGPDGETVEHFPAGGPRET